MTRSISVKLGVGAHNQVEFTQALLATYYDGITIPDFLRKLSEYPNVDCLNSLRAELAPAVAYIKPGGCVSNDLKITTIELEDNAVVCRVEAELCNQTP